MAEIVSIARAFGEATGIPPLLTLAIIAGESLWDVWDTTGCSGLCSGGIQVFWPLHGGGPWYWTGISGLERALWHMAPRWLSVSTAGWETPWGMATYWSRAQGAEFGGCLANAPRALQMAYEAWQDYGGG